MAKNVSAIFKGGLDHKPDSSVRVGLLKLTLKALVHKWSLKLGDDEPVQYIDEWPLNNSKYYEQPEKACVPD